MPGAILTPAAGAGASREDASRACCGAVRSLHRRLDSLSRRPRSVKAGLAAVIDRSGPPVGPRTRGRFGRARRAQGEVPPMTTRTRPGVRRTPRGRCGARGTCSGSCCWSRSRRARLGGHHRVPRAGTLGCWCSSTRRGPRRGSLSSRCGRRCRPRRRRGRRATPPAAASSTTRPTVRRPPWCAAARVARENVGYTTGSADSLFKAYMRSPGHRANILSRDTQFIGLGTVSAPWAAHPTIPMHWNTMRFVGGSCPEGVERDGVDAHDHHPRPRAHAGHQGEVVRHARGAGGSDRSASYGDT